MFASVQSEDGIGAGAQKGNGDPEQFLENASHRASNLHHNEGLSASPGKDAFPYVFSGARVYDPVPLIFHSILDSDDTEKRRLNPKGIVSFSPGSRDCELPWEGNPMR